MTSALFMVCIIHTPEMQDHVRASIGTASERGVTKSMPVAGTKATLANPGTGTFLRSPMEALLISLHRLTPKEKAAIRLRFFVACPPVPWHPVDKEVRR